MENKSEWNWTKEGPFVLQCQTEGCTGNGDYRRMHTDSSFGCYCSGCARKKGCPESLLTEQKEDNDRGTCPKCGESEYQSYLAERGPNCSYCNEGKQRKPKEPVHSISPSGYIHLYNEYEKDPESPVRCRFAADRINSNLCDCTYYDEPYPDCMYKCGTRICIYYEPLPDVAEEGPVNRTLHFEVFDEAQNIHGSALKEKCIPEYKSEKTVTVDGKEYVILKEYIEHSGQRIGNVCRYNDCKNNKGNIDTGYETHFINRNLVGEKDGNHGNYNQRNYHDCPYLCTPCAIKAGWIREKEPLEYVTGQIGNLHKFDFNFSRAAMNKARGGPSIRETFNISPTEKAMNAMKQLGLDFEGGTEMSKYMELKNLEKTIEEKKRLIACREESHAMEMEELNMNLIEAKIELKQFGLDNPELMEEIEKLEKKVKPKTKKTEK